MKSFFCMRRGWSVLFGLVYVLSGFIPEAPAEEGGISEFRVIDDRALIRVASTSEAYFVFVVATNVFDLTGQPAESTVIPRRGPVTDFFFNNTNTSAGTFFFALRSNANCDPIDNDGDGIDDVIEALIPFLDSTNPADAYADHDGDGWDTRTEIYLGTNPDDPEDSFGPIDRTRFAPAAGSVVFDGGFVLNVIEDMTTPFQASGAGRAGAVWAALNVDPYADLVAIDPFTDELQVYLGQPDGTLSLAYTLSTGGAGPLAVDARNVIGDAAIDVIVGHSDGSVTFFEGDGDGGLTYRPDLTVTNLGTIVSITAEDVDGDGDIDIVVSGGDQVTILLNADDPVSSNPIANGDFSDGLQQWSVLPNGGQVSVQGGRALFEEQGAFQTGIEQAFYLPANPETLTLDILESRLAGAPGALPDVFEVLLTDLDGNPLLPTFRPDAESLFNRGSSGDRLGTGTALNATTVSVDLSSLAGDHPARVRFALVGSPGPNSFVAIDNVSVLPDAVYAESFTPVALPGAFINSGGVVATDRDGNGLPDILVEDAGLGILILFENQGGGVFVRNELQPFDYGCPPELPWAFENVNPISEAKYFVADGLTWQVHPYLIDGTALDPVTPVAGTAIQSVETHPDGSRTWLIHAGDPQLYVYDANLNHLGTWSPDAISNVIDIAVAGTDLWLLSEHVVFLGGDPEDPENYETEYRMSLFANEFVRISGSTAPAAQWTLPGTVVAPRYLISDALELRVMDDTARVVYNFNFSGALLGQWSLAPENANPRGLARSGTDLFVADRDDLVVYRYAGGMNRTSGTGTATEAFALSPSNLEPVDISDPATPIELDTLAEGEFVVGNETLDYSLTISEPVTVVIEAISLEGDPWNFEPFYTVTDPNGEFLSPWGYSLIWDREPLALTTTGIYMLAFNTWGETGTFSYVARSLIPTSTQPLNSGVLTTNTIAAAGDIHRYTFSLTNTAAMIMTPGDGDNEVAWRVADADSTTLFSGTFWSWETLRLPYPAGDYTLDFWHLPESTGDYSFTFSVLDISTSTPIDLGETYTNTFTAVPEVHVYTVDVTTNVVLLAEPLANDVITRWSLIGPDDENIFDTSFNIAGPRFLDTPGEYTLYVYTTDDVGEYVFRLREYTFTPQPLTMGVSITGTVASAEALVYEFDLTNSAIVNFTRISSWQPLLQWEAYGPDEERLFNLSSFASQGPFTLDQTGTYSVVLYSRNGFSGSGVFRADTFPYQDDIPVTPIDFNTVVSGSMTSAFWEAHYTFEVNEPMVFGFNRISAGSPHLQYRLTDPDGTVQFTVVGNSAPRLYEVTGTYTLAVQSVSATVPVAYSFEFVAPTPVPTEVISLDTVVTSVVAEAFQVRTYDVDITAGQTIKPESRAGIIVGGSFRWSMHDPSTNALFSNRNMSPFLSSSPDAFIAPETGTYRVTVTGFNTATGTTAFILYDVPPDPAPVPLVFDEVYSPLLIPAQTHRYTFTITDPVTVYYKAIASSNSGITATSGLLGPDDVTIYGPVTGNDRGPYYLTDPGTYTLEVTGALGTGDFYFQLWEVPQHDPIPVTYRELGTAVITAPGERWSFTFEGQAGDRVYLESLLGDNRFSARLFDPDGATLQTQSLNSDMNVVELSADGTYRIDVFFTGSSSAAFDGILRFRLWNVQTAEAIPLRIGDAIAGHIAGPRGRAVYTFEGETGDRYFFDRQRLGQYWELNNSFNWWLSTPSSAVLFSNNWVNGGVVELPETGTYTLNIEGRHNQRARTFRFQVWPYAPPAPVAINLGDAVSGALSAPGLTNIYTFSASAGDDIALSGLNIASTIRYRLIDPNGNSIAGPSSFSLNPSPLPLTGTYEVRVTENFSISNDRLNRYGFRIGLSPLPSPPPVADLRTIEVETPGVIVSNPALVEITWTVTNAGAVATSSGGWVDRIVLSASRSLYGQGDEWYFDVPRIGDLAVGETYTTSHLVAMPADFEGEFSVFVIADANNEEIEVNEGNNVSAGVLTSVYREERPLDASPAIELDFADGTRFPQGEQIVISGNAKAIAAAENVIFILDASGSAFFDEGFDANGDGIVDERDDINHDGYVGSGWDIQIVAMEALANAMQDTGTDLRISPIVWANEQFILDSGPESFRQTFIRPDQDRTGSGRPDVLEAMDLVRYAEFAIVLSRLYIEGFTGIDFAAGNNLEQGVLGAIERIDQAQEVGRTRVILLVDAGPATSADVTPATAAELAGRGITFEVFQILDPDPIAPETQILADLIDADPSSSGRATVMEQTEDLVRAIVETLSVAGVTVNGVGAESVDASGRFFTPYVVQPGTQTVTVAAYDTRGVSVSREFTIVGFDANDTNDVVLTDLGDAMQWVYPGLTFRPTDNVLVADAAVANRSGFAQRSPFEARILEVIPSTASVLDPDRIDPDGVPVVLLDPYGLDLAPNATGAVVQTAIANPERERIELRTEIRGRANQLPRFTTVPPPAVMVSNLWSYSVGVIDDDGDPVDLTLAEHPAAMSFVGNVLSWMPESGDAGYHGVRLRAEDDRGGRAEQVFQVLVEENVPNRPPVFFSVPITALPSGDDYLYVPDVRDPDGDTLTFQLISPPPGFSVDPVTGAVSYPAIPDGVYELELEADDGNGGVAVQRFDLSVGVASANASAPMILTTPPIVAVVGQTYQYFPSAYDPDGDTLTFSLPTAPTGMNINPVNGHITWIPATNQVGAHSVLLRADDPGGLFASQFFTVNVQTTALNRTPLITGFPSGYATEEEPYETAIVAEDPDADPLSFGLELAPAGMAIDATSGAVSWLPPSGSTGIHTARVAVADNKGATAYLTWFVDVRASNTPPVFVSAPPSTTLPAGATYRFTVEASDAEDAVTYVLIEGPAGMTLDPALGVVRWETSVSDIGAVPVRIGAVDDRGEMTEQAFTLTVEPDTTAPEVMVSVSSLYASPGETSTVRVTASDDVGVVSVGLWVDAVDTPLDGSGFADVVPAVSGLLPLQGYAVDAAGNTGVYEVVLRVFDPSDTNPPDIVITSPTNQTGVAMYFAVEGEISDPEDNLDYYTIDIARADTLNHVEPFVLALDCDDCFTELVRVHTASVNGVLGYIDPTVYPNDDYVIRVTAFDINGQGWTEGVVVSIQGQVKPGQFTLDFTDVRIPTRGVPIEIVRRYDSLRRESLNAFGFGWSILAQDPDIRETVRDDVLPYSTISLYPLYVGARVFLNDPDGYRVGYTFAAPFAQSSLIGTLYSPEFNPDPGVFDALSDPVENLTVTLKNGGEAFLPLIPLPYNPSQYKLTRRDGSVYLYDQFTGLKQVTDRFGNSVTFGNDSITHSDGYTLSMLRDDLGRVVSIVSTQGVLAAYGYDDAGNLATHTDAENRITQFFYYDDPPHALRMIIGPDGQILHEGEFDEAGRMVRQSGGGAGYEREFDPTTFTGVDRDIYGRENLVVYNNDGLIVGWESFDGTVIEYEYDEWQRLIAKTADGATVTFEYDSVDNLSSYSNAMGQVWSYAHGANGIEGMTDPMGHTISFDVSGDDRITSMLLPNGASRALMYDEQGRLTNRVDENGYSLSMTYSTLDVPDLIQWDDGSFRQYAWMSGGYLDYMIDEEGYMTFFQQNSDGAITQVVNHAGAVTSIEFDGRSRAAVRYTDADGETFTREDLYDADDIQVGFRYNFPNSETVDFGIVPGIPDAITNVIAQGVMNEWHFGQDGGTTTVADASGAVSTFVFQNDLIRSYTDRLGRERIYRYDLADRLTQQVWRVDGDVVNDVRIEYNHAGYVTNLSDFVASYTYTLNTNHQIMAYSAVGVSNSLPPFSIEYTLDPAGELIGSTDSLGITVASTLDAKYELADRTWEWPGQFEARVDITRDLRAMPVRVDRYASLTATTASVVSLMEWNHDRDLVSLRHEQGVSSNTVADYAYSYTPARWLTQMVVNAETVLYEHDPMGQLLSVERSLGNDEVFVWDDGNPVGSNVVVGLANRLLQQGDLVMTYDLEGNMIVRSNVVSGQHFILEYDLANQVVQIEERDGAGTLVNTVEYWYDAFGRRVARILNGVPTYTVFDFSQPHADLDASTNVVAVYLNSDEQDLRFGRYRVGEEVHWYLADRLWNVRQIADAQGNVIAEVDYEAFGLPISNSAPGITDRFLWAGREYEEVGSLYYFHFRHYDPVLRRFTSQDPVGYQMGEYNMYRYAYNNPADEIDILGFGPAVEYPWPLIIQSFIAGCIVSVAESLVCDGVKALGSGLASAAGYGGGASGGSGGAGSGGGGPGGGPTVVSEEKGDFKATGYLWDCAIGGTINAVTGGMAAGAGGRGFKGMAREYSVYGEQLAVNRAVRRHNASTFKDAVTPSGLAMSAAKCAVGVGMDSMLGNNKPGDGYTKIFEAALEAGLK